MLTLGARPGSLGHPAWEPADAAAPELENQRGGQHPTGPILSKYGASSRPGQGLVLLTGSRPRVSPAESCLPGERPACLGRGAVRPDTGVKQRLPGRIRVPGPEGCQSRGSGVRSTVATPRPPPKMTRWAAGQVQRRGFLVHAHVCVHSLSHAGIAKSPLPTDGLHLSCGSRAAFGWVHLLYLS